MSSTRSRKRYLPQVNFSEYFAAPFSEIPDRFPSRIGIFTGARLELVAGDNRCPSDEADVMVTALLSSSRIGRYLNPRNPDLPVVKPDWIHESTQHGVLEPYGLYLGRIRRTLRFRTPLRHFPESISQRFGRAPATQTSCNTPYVYSFIDHRTRFLATRRKRRGDVYNGRR